MLKTSTSITNLYVEFMVETAIKVNPGCGLRKYEKGLRGFFSSVPAERSEADRPLHDIEKIFLESPKDKLNEVCASH